MNSQTIVDCLYDSAPQQGHKGFIAIRYYQYSEISSTWKIGTLLLPGNEFQADAVVICSGNSNSIWKMIESLGHTIENPVPSLFTFNIIDKRIDGLSGVSVNDVKIKYRKD